MAKRFTDSEKWKKPFLRGMKAPYKLLWLYILDECDHAGIWQVDFEVAEIKIGEKLKIELALEQLKCKVHPFDDGNKWFIPDFIEFQYITLNPENRAHKSVIDLLTKYSLLDILKEGIKPLETPLQGRKDKAMDIAKEEDKEESKIPEISEFLAHAKILCDKAKINFPDYSFSIESKYQAWVADGWKDGHGEKIKVWKTKLANTLPHLKPIKQPETKATWV